MPQIANTAQSIQNLALRQLAQQQLAQQQQQAAVAAAAATTTSTGGASIAASNLPQLIANAQGQIVAINATQVNLPELFQVSMLIRFANSMNLLFSSLWIMCWKWPWLLILAYGTWSRVA